MSEKIFKELMAVNVNEHTEKKNGLTYLSWAWAWAEMMTRFPEVTYEVVKADNGLPYVYDPKTGYMVYTRVTIEGLTHEMWLPVMDSANNAMKAEPYVYSVKNPYFKYARKDPRTGKMVDKYGTEQTEFIEKRVEAATMFDVNKTIMRCLVKNLATFGLGLYIYAGEDLPQEVEEVCKPTPAASASAPAASKAVPPVSKTAMMPVTKAAPPAPKAAPPASKAVPAAPMTAPKAASKAAGPSSPASPASVQMPTYEEAKGFLFNGKPLAEKNPSFIVWVLMTQTVGSPAYNAAKVIAENDQTVRSVYERKMAG